MSIYRCAGWRRKDFDGQRCTYEAPRPWPPPCPGCRRFYAIEKVGSESAEQQRGRSSFARAAEVSVKYIPTGIAGFDKLLGGGLVAGSPILLGGFRGVGKTTLLCMVCDAVAKIKGSALYTSAEESDSGVINVAHRLGLTSDAVEVMGNQLIVEKVIARAAKDKPFIVIYDSLQKYVSETSAGAPGSGAQAKAVAAAILDHCRSTKTCAVIVNQMDKQGEMKGGTDAAHDVDTVLVFAFPKPDDEDAPEEEGVRLLAVDGKNRNGPDNAKTYWRMTDDGRLEEIQKRSKLLEFPKRKKYRKGDED